MLVIVVALFASATTLQAAEGTTDSTTTAAAATAESVSTPTSSSTTATPTGGAAEPQKIATEAFDPQKAASVTLEQMARVNFGAMTDAEVKFVSHAPYRDLVWSGPSSDPDNAANDLSKAASWDKARTIRADIVRWILTDARASKLVHPSGIGIAGARITGTLDLSYATVTLPITLLSCSIADGLDLSFSNIGSIDLRRSWTGPIDAQQALVHGDVLLRVGRYDYVNFYRAVIDGNLDCSSGHFIGDDPLSMVEATIKGDALFHQGFETGGIVDFRLAKVGQSLSFNHARFIGKSASGLNAERATVGGAFYWVDITLTPHTMLDLSGVHTGALWDDAASWPAPGNLELTGFVYLDFSGGPATAESRLEWIHRQPRSDWVQPQPYRQLAHVLRENGAEEGATVVEIAHENAITEYGGIPLGQRIWRQALRATIGYGYRPLRALWWILLFVVQGTVLFGWGYRRGLITPTEESAYDSFCRHGTPPPHYPPFSSFVYSLENFLPVVDLHQETYWRPNPRHRRAGHKSAKPAESVRETVPARLLRWYLWLHILAGWTITPLLFAGLAGLLRNS
jgi:hypothetical protein